MVKEMNKLQWELYVRVVSAYKNITWKSYVPLLFHVPEADCCSNSRRLQMDSQRQH